MIRCRKPAYDHSCTVALSVEIHLIKVVCWFVRSFTNFVKCVKGENHTDYNYDQETKDQTFIGHRTYNIRSIVQPNAGLGPGPFSGSVIFNISPTT